MNKTHTPGPWEVAQKNLSIYRKLCQPVILAGQKEVARVPALSNAGGVLLPDSTENAANARLIAAAPDLLELLQRIARLKTYGFGETPQDGEDAMRVLDYYITAARDAVAKAVEVGA